MAIKEMELENLVDVRAEQKLLACILKTTEALMRLPENFSPDALTSTLNRSILLVIENLYNKGASPDPIAIADALPPDMQRELEAHGGWGFLETLKEIPVDPKNTEFIAKDLIDLATRRRIGDTGGQIAGMASDPQPIPKIIENIEVAISDIEGRTDVEVISIGSKSLEFVEEKMSHPAEVPGLESGFKELDRSIQGFQKGRLYVVGAPLKTGKSMILLNWAKHLAVDRGLPILWLSTEHSWEDEFSRLLSLTSQVREVTINNGTFSGFPVHVEQVSKAVEQLSGSPFWFCSMPNFNVSKIKRITRKYCRVFGVKALFFDYVKPVSDTANVREWQELGLLADGLKTLAASEGIPVITAVQINREGRKEFREGGEMDTDFYAGSDRIAQFMSVGMVLRKPSKKESEEPDLFRVLEVSANRHGAANYKMLLTFEADTIKLSELKRL